MRRRVRHDDDTGAPLRLRRYRAEEWRGAGCHPECAYWQAVMAWQEGHPDDHLDLLDPGPDAPFHPELI